MLEKRKLRLYEISAGIVFLLSTLCYSIGNGIVEGMLTQTTRARVDDAVKLGIGVSLELVNSAAVIAIGILLFLRLREKSNSVMLRYLLSRLAEGIRIAIASLLVLRGTADPLRACEIISVN